MIGVKCFRDRIHEIFNPAEIEQIVDSYLELYYGSDMTAKQAWEEIVCDAMGDMNVFALFGIEENTPAVLESIKKTANETRTEKTRGPPAERAETQFSRDENERSRALRPGEMVNGFRDKINWPAYYKNILDDKYNPMYYDDGALTYMQLGGSLLTFRMRRNGEWEVIELEEGDNVYILGGDGNVIPGSQGQKLAWQPDTDISGNGLQIEKSGRDTSKGSRNNQDRGKSESGGSRSSADYSGNVSRKTDTSVNRGSAIYIKDGHAADGKTVEFLFLLVLCYNCFVYSTF